MMKKFIPLLFLLIMTGGAVVVFALAEAKRTPEWEIELGKYIQSQRGWITIELITQATKPQTLYEYVGYSTNGNRPPFPPETVRCVLLKHHRRFDFKLTTNYSVIFISFHPEIHRATWAVFEGETSPFSQDFIDDMSRLGCDLGLETL